LRAAMGMARLRAAQGRAAEGHALVAEVYAKFPPGQNAGDLRAARDLLAANGDRQAATLTA
ncbi:MAG: hypothetical protein ABI205_08185, partial [Gemmatimonadaceae bacterium]